MGRYRQRHCKKGWKEVFLSALEYRLLLYFLQHKGKLVTRENLRDAIWDSAGEYVSDNALNVYVKRLREKVETDPAEPDSSSPCAASATSGE